MKIKLETKWTAEDLIDDVRLYYPGNPHELRIKRISESYVQMEFVDQNLNLLHKPFSKRTAEREAYILTTFNAVRADIKHQMDEIFGERSWEREFHYQDNEIKPFKKDNLDAWKQDSFRREPETQRTPNYDGSPRPDFWKP